jgi:hypothetical protein
MGGSMGAAIFVTFSFENNQYSYCPRSPVAGSSPMPFKPWIRSISPLAWCLGVSTVANIITMIGVLYIAFGTTAVRVDGGYIRARVNSSAYDEPFECRL